MDYKELLILVIATTLGSAVRIIRETQIERPGALKIAYILICGYFISYLLYGFLKEREWFIYFGQLSAVCGIVALDMVEVLIKRLPNIIADKIEKL